MHGKVSLIKHDNKGIFRSIPQDFKSTRYHSLSASTATLPDILAITAATAESGVIMAVRHRECTLEAMQYHPESILSEQGNEVLRNFLRLKGGKWIDNPESGVLDGALPDFDIKALPQLSGNDSPEDVEKRKKLAAKVPSILEKIYAQRLADVTLAKSTPGTTPADLTTLLGLHLAPPLLPLLPRLKSTPITTAGKPMALMAEIKRASPSKGPIAMGINAAEQAQRYALAGASVISVLTEPTWFKGSLLDMRLAREAVANLPNRPAILRKDFVLDEYQIAEARLWGADTVLLIVAMLPPARLRTLYAYSLGLGMEPLVEVNNAKEMALALELGAAVIGVNNRNLHDFEVDMGTTSRLVDMVKGREVVLCALSGIAGSADVRGYREQGVGAVLVGEALMRAKDPSNFIRELLDWPAEPAKDEGAEEGTLVKICGVRSVEDAVGIAEAGADMIGLNFVPTSKRLVSVDVAKKISAAIRSRAFNTSVDEQEDDGREDEGTKNKPWFTTHARTLRTSLKTLNRPLLVGVFQDQPLETIIRLTAIAQLDLVQFHGEEPAEWAKFIPVPVIKVFHVGAEGSGGLEGVGRPGLNQFVMVDSVGAGKLSGGSGVLVDWGVAKTVVDNGEIVSSVRVQQQRQVKSGEGGVKPPLPSDTPLPIFLAGGLKPENVREAVECVRPWVVDVAGGVELEGGKGKDLEKVRAFVKAAKRLE